MGVSCNCEGHGWGFPCLDFAVRVPDDQWSLLKHTPKHLSWCVGRTHQNEGRCGIEANCLGKWRDESGVGGSGRERSQSSSNSYEEEQGQWETPNPSHGTNERCLTVTPSAADTDSLKKEVYCL